MVHRPLLAGSEAKLSQNTSVPADGGATGVGLQASATGIEAAVGDKAGVDAGKAVFVTDGVGVAVRVDVRLGSGVDELVIAGEGVAVVLAVALGLWVVVGVNVAAAMLVRDAVGEDDGATVQVAVLVGSTVVEGEGVETAWSRGMDAGPDWGAAEALDEKGLRRWNASPARRNRAPRAPAPWEATGALAAVSGKWTVDGVLRSWSLEADRAALDAAGAGADAGAGGGSGTVWSRRLATMAQRRVRQRAARRPRCQHRAKAAPRRSLPRSGRRGREGGGRRGAA
jgi:hypothetical protein